MPQNTPPYSYHIFMFPFKWDSLPKGEVSVEKVSLESRIDIVKFNEAIDTHKWKRFEFVIDTHRDYNEWAYFYEFTKESIFPVELKKVFYQYEYILSEDLKYRISINKENTIYELKIDKISLLCYETGVALISFHLINNNHNSPDDILKINDFGRRCYPIFLDKNFEISTTKKEFLANEISIGYIGKVKNDEIGVSVEEEQETQNERWVVIENAQDNFERYQNQENLKDAPIIFPKFIKNILEKDKSIEGENKFYEFKKDPNRENGGIYIQPLIDDRMFVLCWYGNNKTSNDIRRYDSKKDIYGYQTNNFWYQFVFVDNAFPATLNQRLRQAHIEQSTNVRWFEGKPKLKKGNTLYGITRYSFMILTDESEYSKNDLTADLQTVYYKIATLCLIQRASVLRFSNEISKIENLEDEKVIEKTQKLYRKYLKFVNQIYFREITAQEQGIELYDKLQEMMKIEQNVKDLDKEIQALLNITSLLEDEKRTNLENERKKAEVEKKEEEEKNAKKINIITMLFTILVLPSFIVGYYGMNVFNQQIIEFGNFELWLGLIGIVVVQILTYLFLKNAKVEMNDFFKELSMSSKLIGGVLMILFASMVVYPLIKKVTKDTRAKEEKTQIYSSQIDSLQKQLLLQQKQANLFKDSVLLNQKMQEKELKQIKSRLK